MRLMTAAGRAGSGFVAAGTPPDLARYVVGIVAAFALVPAVCLYFDWARRMPNG